MGFFKGAVVNVYNIKLKDGVDMDAPELMQIIVGETICNFSPDSDDSDSDAGEYEVELDVILNELDEYISNKHSYILSYDWMISSYRPQ